MCNERNHSICYTTTTSSTHCPEQKSKKIIIKKVIIKKIIVIFSRLYLFIRSWKFVIIETSPYDIAHDENRMSSLLIIQSRFKVYDRPKKIERSHRCSITKAVLKSFTIFMGKYPCWALFLIEIFKAN